jgi:hypothetical protein
VIVNSIQIFAGLTNITLTLISNSVPTSGSTTNRDVVLGSGHSMSIVGYNYYDVNGNQNPIITNTGNYTVDTGLGWGYQSAVTVPGSYSPSFATFAPTSLAFNSVTNLQAATNVSVNCSRLSVANYTTTNFTANPAFWLNNLYQLSGWIVGEGLVGNSSLTGQECGCAISPLHVLVCQHAPYSVGQTLVWLGTDGNLVQRTVYAISTNFNPGADIEVCLLNSPLPATVIPLPMLATNVGNYFPSITNSTFFPIVTGDQGQFLTPNVVQYFAYNESYLTDNSVSLVVSSSSYWLPIGMFHNLTGGDSGCPWIMVVGTNAVLVGHNFAGGGGQKLSPWYADPLVRSNIIAQMATLSTSNGMTVYAPSNISLAAYPTF